MAKTYDESSIQRYAGLQGLRKKPTPYIGPNDSDGLWTCYREPADNAVDQALAGRNSLVHLIVDKTPGVYWVLDSGDGIPVGKKVFEDERGRKEKLSTLYVVTGLTHGGSNFDSDTISRGCFTGDTEVRLLNGKTVTFEQLYSRWCKDDTPIDILSYNLQTRKLQPSKISMVMVAKYTKEIAHVHLGDGSVVKCTYDHPFYVHSEAEIAKVAAEDLKTGMGLVSTRDPSKENQSDISDHRISHVELHTFDDEVPVYDITVDDTHTFFVNPGVLVSNTHGIGIKATNAMSKRMTVWTKRDGDWWAIEYRDAKLYREPYKTKAPTLPHGFKMKRGTAVMFEPDMSLFQKGSKIVPSVMLEWAELTSYLVKGLEVKVTGPNGKTKTFQTKGPQEFLEKQIGALKVNQTGKSFIHSSKEADIAVGFTDAEGSDLVQCYTNGLRNKEGGEHLRALVAALVKSLDPYKGKAVFTPSDLRDGLIGLVNYKIAAPKFNNQPKDKLIDDRVYDIAFKQFLKAWQEFWSKNKGMAKDVVARAALLRSKTSDFLKDKKLVKNVNAAKKTLITKLASVVGNAPPERRELFLVEGDSAGGGAKRARDKSYQAIYPLKGKPLNPMEAAKDKINNNAEIVGLLAALGVNLGGNKPNIEVPYGKIILLADADVDGPLHGKTKVMLCDGTTPTMKQLARRWEKNPTPFWVWSTDTSGALVPALAQLPMKVATKTKMVEIEFDGLTTIRCSLNHKWPVNSSSTDPTHFRFKVPYLRADELSVGDSIRSIYFENTKPREEGRNSYLQWVDPITGKKQLVHQRVKQVLDPKRFNKYKSANKGVMGGAIHIHHHDDDSFNNDPTNLKFVLKEDHYGMHGREMALAYNGSKKHKRDLAVWWENNPEEKRIRGERLAKYNKSEAHRQSVRALNRDPDQIRLQLIGKAARVYLGLVQLGLEVNSRVWDSYRPEKAAFIPSGALSKWGITFKEIRRYIRRKGLSVANARALVKSEDRQKASYPTQCLTKFMGFAKKVHNKYGFVDGSNYSSLRSKRIARKKIPRGTPKWDRGMLDFGKSESKLNRALETYNHTITKVRVIDTEPTDVYCMAVPEYGNFLLADSEGNGIATGNSHINVLLLGVIYKFIPSLIRQGKVFAVRSPLYKGRHKGQVYFGMTQEEVWSAAGSKIDLTYLKGWGEVSPEDLGVALDPGKRQLIQITEADAKGRKTFEELLGKSPAFRKNLFGVE